MRPKTIAWFERLYVVSVALGYALMFREWRDRVEAYGDWQLFVFMLVISLMMPVTLALLVSRRRSRVALALLVLITWSMGTVMLAVAYASGFGSGTEVAALQAVAMAATLLPFTPSARAWLKTPRTRRVGPETLGRTFE
ncbi:MAG TPA: hypothetical protein VIT45_05295 [Allosphingosinicella sp.]